MGCARSLPSSRYRSLMVMSFSVAMSVDVESVLRDHLARADGQEDLCFAIWHPSTGRTRQSALITSAVLPLEGERDVHGNASFQSDFVLRAAQMARQEDGGLTLMHSHPEGVGWQMMSVPDERAEASIVNIAQEVCELPLVGMTLATGDQSWSARLWQGSGRNVSHREAEAVRCIGERLGITFNDRLRPRPKFQDSQTRTVSAWGEEAQAFISRLKVLIVGAGSVGGIVAERLARTGVQTIGLMDHESVELVNLDRLLGATADDVRLSRSKVEVAERTVRAASTAAAVVVRGSDRSVCEPEGMLDALDYDIMFSCVDRPWPRHVLNTIAYADLVPVIDVGIRVQSFPDGALRNAYWRTSVARPCGVCLACLGQFDPAFVQVERDGSLDSPSYLEGLPEDSPLKIRQNVAIFSASAASAALEHFISYLITPSGFGDTGPIEYALATHSMTRSTAQCVDGCPYSGDAGVGDRRFDPTGRHEAAERARANRLGPPKRSRLQRALTRLFSRRSSKNRS